MSLDERHARLWHRLGLGPVWASRDGAHASDGGRAMPDPVADPMPAQGGAAVAQLDWEALQQAVSTCTACGLCKKRTQTVFGVGSARAQWMVVGEAPGAEEDERGEPFVGQAGRLLDSILAAAGLGRRACDERAVYIANVLKCRPPGNRDPEPEEAARCEPYLMRQIALVSPA